MVQRMPQAGELDPIETASRDELQALQLERLRWSLRHAYENVAHYRAAFDAAGVHPEDLRSLSDLAKFPFTDVTNADGRCATPLLAGEQLTAGKYELVFAAGDYFAAQGVQVPEPRFVDEVTIAFGVADAEQNYHVPLVVSPWAYSTYRGS